MPIREWIEEAKRSLRGTFQEVVRIVRVSRKPGREEFTLMLKICSLGLIILGVYGFIILYLFFVLFVH